MKEIKLPLKYLQEIENKKRMSADTAIALSERIKEGDQEALELLIKAHLYFVVRIAKQYQNQGMYLCDLINEGNIGLIKAAKKYEEIRGYSFTGYSVWFIRHAILLALAEKSRLVQIPLNLITLLNKVDYIYRSLEQQFQRAPCADEIAEGLKVPIQEVINVIKYGKIKHVSLNEFLQKEDKYKHMLV